MSTPVDDASTVITPDQYHPEFDKKVSTPTDRTLTLVSSDGIRFRVSANLLITTSPVFESMFSLPTQLSSEEDEIIIDKEIVAASSGTVEILLKMVTGQTIPVFYGIQSMLPIMRAAEKWDMQGPLSIFRQLVRNEEFIADEPLEVYGIGIHLNWNEVAEAATKFIRHADLYWYNFVSEWEEIPAKALMLLMRHHRNRQEQLESAFGKSIVVSRFVHECSNPSGESRPISTYPESRPTYNELLPYRLQVLKAKTLAATFDVSPCHVFEEQDTKPLIEAACLSGACSLCRKERFDVFMFLRNLNKVWASLPQILKVNGGNSITELKGRKRKRKKMTN